MVYTMDVPDSHYLGWHNHLGPQLSPASGHGLAGVVPLLSRSAGLATVAMLGQTSCLCGHMW
jgi:hypothetical protein